MLMYITRLHCVMGQQKIYIMNIIFKNIEGKLVTISEFVMLIGQLTVGENRRLKAETAVNNLHKFYTLKGTDLQNIFLYFR